MAKKISEQELAEPITDWLESKNCIVYQEVQTISGNRVDIVGIHKSLIIAIELKTTFGLSVIEQAYNNRRFANLVYIAVPYHKPIGWKKDPHTFARTICKILGIGVLEIEHDETGTLKNIYEFCRSKRYQIHDQDLMTNCNDKLLQFNKENNVVAGQKTGKYLTPYQQTMSDLRKFLKTNINGVTMAEIMVNVKTHYRGKKPEASLAQAINLFELKDIEITHRVVDGRWTSVYVLRKKST